MQRLVIKTECRITWTVNPPLLFLRACDQIHNDHKYGGKVKKDFSLCSSLKAGSWECDLDTDVTSSVFVWVGRHNDLDICTWTWWPNVGNRCASQTHQEQRKKIGTKPHVLHVSQTIQNKHTSTKLKQESHTMNCATSKIGFDTLSNSFDLLLNVYWRPRVWALTTHEHSLNRLVRPRDQNLETKFLSHWVAAHL